MNVLLKEWNEAGEQVLLEAIAKQIGSNLWLIESVDGRHSLTTANPSRYVVAG